MNKSCANCIWWGGNENDRNTDVARYCLAPLPKSLRVPAVKELTHGSDSRHCHVWRKYYPKK